MVDIPVCAARSRPVLVCFSISGNLLAWGVSSVSSADSRDTHLCWARRVTTTGRGHDPGPARLKAQRLWPRKRRPRTWTVRPHGELPRASTGIAAATDGGASTMGLPHGRQQSAVGHLAVAAIPREPVGDLGCPPPWRPLRPGVCLGVTAPRRGLLWRREGSPVVGSGWPTGALGSIVSRSSAVGRGGAPRAR